MISQQSSHVCDPVRCDHGCSAFRLDLREQGYDQESLFWAVKELLKSLRGSQGSSMTHTYVAKKLDGISCFSRRLVVGPVGPNHVATYISIYMPAVKVSWMQRLGP